LLLTPTEPPGGPTTPPAELAAKLTGIDPLTDAQIAD
jgi:hypothetical protein